MNNLIDFIKKYLHVMTFIFLQVIAIVLIYNSMNYPRFVIASYTQVLTAPINGFCNKVIRHFNLSAENNYLVEQNVQLMRNQNSSFLVSEDTIMTKIDTIVDSLSRVKKCERMYDYFSANVIYNTIHKKNNYLMIDKGLEDGVTYDMAVLSSQGVVGVVTNVSQHFATITSILHPDSRISAKVVPANQLGTVVWRFGQSQYAYLEDVTENSNINEGDSVVTSGYSNIFPSNVLIGVICEKTKRSSNPFLTLKVKLATDFNHINSVYLVKNLYRSELDTLKSKMIDE